MRLFRSLAAPALAILVVAGLVGGATLLATPDAVAISAGARASGEDTASVALAP